MEVFCVELQCELVGRYRRFGGTCCFLKMKAFHSTKRRYLPTSPHGIHTKNTVIKNLDKKPQIFLEVIYTVLNNSETKNMYSVKISVCKIFKVLIFSPKLFFGSPNSEGYVRLCVFTRPYVDYVCNPG
jgi:hypothetical protein